ncbi:hypothetical protein BT63DRAFT_209170 [Microthyrium microscopicum]|uniref:Rhodopsin domain-containing protein n=1 Tax=Microthyrium microscopicum TaxID=703497 RepID=A0A6A6UJ74_9PEZI|nr:hypothetical protein BT63DRAFT_209170 [Microthyrium microscopicum]
MLLYYFFHYPVQHHAHQVRYLHTEYVEKHFTSISIAQVSFALKMNRRAYSATFGSTTVGLTFTPQPTKLFDYITPKVILILLIFSWLFFMVRVYVKIRYLKRVSAMEDYFMAAALLTFTALCGCFLPFGYWLLSGRILQHFKQVPDLYITSTMLIFVTNLLLKLSIGSFFLRVLNKKGARFVVYVAMIFSTLVNLNAIVFCLITCGSPHNAIDLIFYESCKGSPKISLQVFVWQIIYLPSYSTLAIDVALSILPIPMLMQTTLDRKQKATVIIFLCFSTMGCVCSALKIYYIVGSTEGGNQGTSLREEAYVSSTTGEMAAYIIGSSITTSRPLFVDFLRKTGSKLDPLTSHFRWSAFRSHMSASSTNNNLSTANRSTLHTNQSSKSQKSQIEMETQEHNDRWRGSDATRSANANNFEVSPLGEHDTDVELAGVDSDVDEHDFEEFMVNEGERVRTGVTTTTPTGRIVDG